MLRHITLLTASRFAKRCCFVLELTRIQRDCKSPEKKVRIISNRRNDDVPKFIMEAHCSATLRNTAYFLFCALSTSEEGKS